MNAMFNIFSKPATNPRVIDSVEALALLEEVVRENGADHTGGPYFVNDAFQFECITGKLLGKLGYTPGEAYGAYLPYHWNVNVTSAESLGAAPRRAAFTREAARLLEDARLLNDNGYVWGEIFTRLSGVDLNGIPVEG